MTIYLYIKTHSVTGLKYFGKTTKKDPHKYTGSGKYWKRHLKKHGSDFTTEIIASFQDDDSCKEFALNFSKENDIVDSPNWANLQEENGLDGAPLGHEGHKFTQEQLQKISESSKQRWADPEFKKMMNEKRKWSDKRKQEQSVRLTGTKRPEHSEKMRGRNFLTNDHPFYAAHKTEEHKQKIKESLSGKPKSDEHRKKLKETFQNRSPEDWQKILENRRLKSKPKFEIDGISYVSLSQASEELGITPFFVRKRITHWY